MDSHRVGCLCCRMLPHLGGKEQRGEEAYSFARQVFSEMNMGTHSLELPLLFFVLIYSYTLLKNTVLLYIYAQTIK